MWPVLIVQALMKALTAIMRLNRRRANQLAISAKHWVVCIWGAHAMSLCTRPPRNHATGDAIARITLGFGHAYLWREMRPRLARHRIFPVCPREYRPGCGHTVRPCGWWPT